MLVIGSSIGTILRYLIKDMQIYNYYGNIPINTLIINISGALIMALILTFAFEVWEFNSKIRIGITIGLLGSFTTFSTLCKETVGLINNGEYFLAITYISLTVILGLGVAYLGTLFAYKLGSKITKIKAPKNCSLDNLVYTKSVM